LEGYHLGLSEAPHAVCFEHHSVSARAALALLRTQGFTFASLQEVEKDSAYTLDPDAALKYGGTLPDQFMDSRHRAYPPFKPKPFAQLKSLCQ
jgi:hypothetical protein